MVGRAEGVPTKLPEIRLVNVASVKLADDTLAEIKFADVKFADVKLVDDKLTEDKLVDDKLTEDKSSEAKLTLGPIINPLVKLYPKVASLPVFMLPLIPPDLNPTKIELSDISVN